MNGKRTDRPSDMKLSSEIPLSYILEMREAIRLGRMPTSELDQAFWALMEGEEFPLPSVARKRWRQAFSEGRPEARAISDPISLLRFIDTQWPGTEIRIVARKGALAVKVRITCLGHGIESRFEDKGGLDQIGFGIVDAFLHAHRGAVDLQHRLAQVDDLPESIPPFEEWPIEEVEPGRFAPVLHELRLASHSGSTPEGALRLSRDNHKGVYGLMLCRERYERFFPEPGSESVAAPGP